MPTKQERACWECSCITHKGTPPADRDHAPARAPCIHDAPCPLPPPSAHATPRHPWPPPAHAAGALIGVGGSRHWGHRQSDDEGGVCPAPAGRGWRAPTTGPAHARGGGCAVAAKSPRRAAARCSPPPPPPPTRRLRLLTRPATGASATCPSRVTMGRQGVARQWVHSRPPQRSRSSRTAASRMLYAIAVGRPADCYGTTRTTASVVHRGNRAHAI